MSSSYQHISLLIRVRGNSYIIFHRRCVKRSVDGWNKEKRGGIGFKSYVSTTRQGVKNRRLTGGTCYTGTALTQGEESTAARKARAESGMLPKVRDALSESHDASLLSIFYMFKLFHGFFFIQPWRRGISRRHQRMMRIERQDQYAYGTPNIWTWTSKAPTPPFIRVALFGTAPKQLLNKM